MQKRTAPTNAEGDVALRRNGSARPSPSAARRELHGSHAQFGCVALLLQGGGALGAYQGGVYQALTEAGIEPTWLAGISIGAINAAIIAGNAPEHRVEKLRAFWEQVTEPPYLAWTDAWPTAFVQGETARTIFNQMSSALVAMRGALGFFKPRVTLPWFNPPGTIDATSFYDTRPLKVTLEKLIDFDRIHADGIRLSVGAVNVRSGNFVYFDSKERRITPDHIMASGAMPPGFPAVEIDGEHYWDGGVVSNTPLQWMAENGAADTLAFQVDLWNARGTFPRTMAEVMTRQKEIQYSSRTRAGTNWLKAVRKRQCAIAELVSQLPEHLRKSPAGQALDAIDDKHVYNIVHLIYRPREYEGNARDYEFSRRSMEEHWRAGYNDAVRSLRHPEIFERPTNLEGVFTFDLAVDGRR